MRRVRIEWHTNRYESLYVIVNEAASCLESVSYLLRSKWKFFHSLRDYDYYAITIPPFLWNTLSKILPDLDLSKDK